MRPYSSQSISPSPTTSAVCGPGPRRPACSAAEGHEGGVGHEHIAAGKGIAVAAPAAGAISLADEMMAGGKAQIGFARARHPVARKRHPHSRAKAGAIAHRPVAAIRAAFLFGPQSGHQPAHILCRIIARVIKAFDLAHGVAGIAQPVDLRPPVPAS